MFELAKILQDRFSNFSYLTKNEKSKFKLDAL
jgi:hypothetical protein